MVHLNFIKSKYFECIFAIYGVWYMQCTCEASKNESAIIIHEMYILYIHKACEMTTKWIVQTFDAWIRNALSLCTPLQQLACNTNNVIADDDDDDDGNGDWLALYRSVRQTCHKILNSKSLIELNNKLSLSVNMICRLQSYYTVAIATMQTNAPESTIEFQLIWMLKWWLYTFIDG